MTKIENVERDRQLVELARAAEKWGKNDKALGLFDDALAVLGDNCIDPVTADVLRWKGTLLRERGETEAAFRCYSLSLEKARSCGSVAHQAPPINSLGTNPQHPSHTQANGRLCAQDPVLPATAAEAPL